MTTQLQTVLDALLYSNPTAEFDDAQSEQDASDKHNEAIVIVRGMMEVEPVGKVTEVGVGGFHVEFTKLLNVGDKLFAAPQAVPAGWKLVPLEPTESMVSSSSQLTAPLNRAVYKAMVAAAPAVEDGV